MNIQHLTLSEREAYRVYRAIPNTGKHAQLFVNFQCMIATFLRRKAYTAARQVQLQVQGGGKSLPGIATASRKVKGKTILTPKRKPIPSYGRNVDGHLHEMAEEALGFLHVAIAQTPNKGETIIALMQGKADKEIYRAPYRGAQRALRKMSHENFDVLAAWHPSMELQDHESKDVLEALIDKAFLGSIRETYVAKSRQLIANCQASANTSTNRKRQAILDKDLKRITKALRYHLTVVTGDDNAEWDSADIRQDKGIYRDWQGTFERAGIEWPFKPVITDRNDANPRKFPIMVNC